MATYRLFPVRADDVRAPARGFIFNDDESALAAAEKMSKGFRLVEIWVGARFIGTASLV